MKRRKFLTTLAMIPIAGAAMKLEELNKMTTAFDGTETMPVLFVGHGSPMNAIGNNAFSRKWAELGKILPRPNAILAVSAHWETRGSFVTAMNNPRTIHDFGGFPRELYEVHYPAPGSPELADETKKTVKTEEIGLDRSWGLDHGTWSILKHMYPAADIPVIQLSLDYTKDPEFHYGLGKSIAPLRDKGVLIMGSGNLVHNLGLVAWNRLDDTGYGYDWAVEANEKMKKFITEGNHKALINYRSQGRPFDLSIPTPEHFLPLLYALGLKKENEKIEFFNDRAVAGSLSMTSLMISGK